MIFVKIDGDENVLASMRYGVKGYPGYVMVMPGTEGEGFARWDSKHKDRLVMMQWIEEQVGDKLSIQRPDAPPPQGISQPQK